MHPAPQIDMSAIKGLPIEHQNYLAMLMRYGFDAFFVSPQAAIGSPLAQRIHQALSALEQARVGNDTTQLTQAMNENMTLRQQVEHLTQTNARLVAENTRLAAELQQAQSFIKAGQAQVATQPQPKASSAGSAKPSAPSVVPSTPSTTQGQITKDFLCQKYNIETPDYSKMNDAQKAEAKKKFERLVKNARSKESDARAREAKKASQPQKPAPLTAPKALRAVALENERSSLPGKLNDDPAETDKVALMAATAIANAEDQTGSGLAVLESMTSEVAVSLPPAPVPMVPPPAMSMPSGLQIPDFMRQSAMATQHLQNAGSLPPMPMPMSSSSMFPGQFPAPASAPVSDQAATMLDGLLD